MGPNGIENFKTLVLIYSFKNFATKLLLQTPHGGPHKMFFLELFEILSVLRVINDLIFTL